MNTKRQYVPTADRPNAPIGWKPRYDILVAPDKISEVLGWFKRGIVVRQSQYIGDSSTCFQPLDNSEQPHWKYGEITDTVLPSECPDVFRILKLETEYDVGIPCPCRYCVSGKRKRKNNPVLVGHDSHTCPKCGNVMGFSFDRPYHDMITERYTTKPETDAANIVECPKLRQAGECWVCNGMGQGKRSLSELSRKERNQAIAQMRVDGWKVHYVRGSDPMWVRERETVVHDTAVGINALVR